MEKRELSEIQKEELKMLKEVISFFEKEKFEYFLCGGSLLGAIRHNGFIPWDDDIDLAMPREEYERFIQMALKNRYIIAENLEISSFEINKLPKPFCKVLNKNIAIIDTADIDKFLWIDIFPFDGLPENEKEVKLIYKKEHLYKLLLRIKISKKKYDNSLKGIAKKVLRILLRPIKIDFFIKKMIKLAKKYTYKDSDLVGNVVWGYGPRERVKKTYFKIKKVNFEDLMVNGILGYHEYLTSVYNNYMQLPPVEERENHNIIMERIK